METIRLKLHSSKALPMLIVAWYVLLLSIGVAIIQGIRK